MTFGAVAVVESPAQLLNVLELGRAQVSLASVKIAVLAPAEGERGLSCARWRRWPARGPRSGVVRAAAGWRRRARIVRAMAAELSGIER